MSNKTIIFISKLFHKLTLQKFIVVVLFIALIIFFVNINSLFKITEGNVPCKFTPNQKQMEGNLNAKAKKYEKDIPNLDNSKSVLSNISDLKSKVQR
jgi:hypothetical protein